MLRMEKVFYEIHFDGAMKEYYYVIRDVRTKKMIFSSELYVKRDNAEKFAKKRTNLYNVQYSVLKQR